MFRFVLLAICAAFLLPGHSFAQDEICDYVRAFERAPFERDAAGHEKFRWIEVHWIGSWMDFDHGWHLECRPSSDSASKAFCSWLMDNTSFEFSTYLPVRILTCHGYRFPRNENIGQWKSEIDLYSENSGQILLQINLEARKKPDQAIRLTVYPRGKDQATEKWPPTC